MKKRELIIKIVALGLLIAAILVSNLSKADGMSISMNDLPIFYSMMGDKPQYHDAAFKAQQALLIQTGITPAVDKVTHYVTNEATSKATTVINESTPLDAKTVFFLGGATYAVCVRKQVTQKFHDPLIHSIMHTVTVSKDSASTGIQIPF